MPVKALSQKELERYARLWKAHGTKPFTFQKAQKTLQLPEVHTRVTLHRLKQKGWLKVKRQDKHFVKSMYTLLALNEILKAITI